MNAASVTEKSLPVGLIRYRPALLLMALAIVGILILALQAGTLREQWLTRQGLPELKNLASAHDADPLTLLVYGEALSNRARFSEAAAELQRAELMLDPNQRDSIAERVHGRLGFTLALLGNVDRAVSSLDRARDINRNSWLVDLGDGAVWINKQNPKLALERFHAANALHPNSYEVNYMLGLAYDENSEPKAAAEALKKVAALAPEFAPGHAELGHALAYQGQVSDAIVQFRIARKLDPQSRDYLFALGDALGRNARTPDEYREAASVLEECEQAAPQNANLVFTLGQLHLRFLNLDAAYRCLKRTTEIRPNIAKAWYNLGRVEQMLGDEKEADQAYSVFKKELALHDNAILAEKRVAANLRDPVARLDLYRRFRAIGNIAGAYTQLKTALQIKPDYSDAHAEMLRFEMDYEQMPGQDSDTSTKQNDTDRLGPPPPDDLAPSTAGASNSQP